MKKLNIEKKVMLHCEACGGYHAEEESEFIILKIIKGKNCNLDQSKLLKTTQQQESPVVVVPEIIPIVTPRKPQGPDEIVPPSIETQNARMRRSIVPPGLRKAFMPPPELQAPN